MFFVPAQWQKLSGSRKEAFEAARQILHCNHSDRTVPWIAANNRPLARLSSMIFLLNDDEELAVALCSVLPDRKDRVHLVVAPEYNTASIPASIYTQNIHQKNIKSLLLSLAFFFLLCFS